MSEGKRVLSPPPPYDDYDSESTIDILQSMSKISVSSSSNGDGLVSHKTPKPKNQKPKERKTKKSKPVEQEEKKIPDLEPEVKTIWQAIFDESERGSQLQDIWEESNHEYWMEENQGSLLSPDPFIYSEQDLPLMQDIEDISAPVPLSPLTLGPSVAMAEAVKQSKKRNRSAETKRDPAKWKCSICGLNGHNANNSKFHSKKPKVDVIILED